LSPSYLAQSIKIRNKYSPLFGMSCSPQLTSLGPKLALVVHPYPESKLSASPQQLLNGSSTKSRIDNGALSVGTRVAILWDVTKGGRKTSVWWSAAIISIASRAARGRSETVQYDAQHGYKKYS
jgi:hypothetical protein